MSDTVSPTHIKPSGWLAIAWRIKDNLANHRTGLIAAGIAFYGMLALFPAITALLALGGIILSPDRIVSQFDRMSGIVPDSVVSIITDQAVKVAGTGSSGLGVAALIALGVAFFSASRGMASLMQGMNVAYDVDEDRGFIAITVTQLVLTCGLVIGLLVGFVVTLFLPVALSVFPTTPIVETGITMLSWGVLLVLTLGGLAMLYRYAPSRHKPPFRWLTPGAIAASLLWVAGSVGFTYYVSTFGTYAETFGALAGVVILLLWLWISAYAVLIGAEVNAEAEAQADKIRSGESAHDTSI